MALIENSEMQLVKVNLFCAEHCHLCDEAKSIIIKLGCVAHNIDITKNDNLFEMYRLRIPVLQRVDNNAELDWPFDSVAVSRFLT